MLKRVIGNRGFYMCEEKEEKPQISVGKLIKKADLQTNVLIHDDAKNKIKDSEYYLVISILGKDILKLNIFAIKNQTITKILIELVEFTPQTVEGIGDILTDFQICDSIIHTTGLCFSGANCYYESYMDLNIMNQENFSVDKLKEAFLKVENVKSVQLIPIQ